MASQMVADSYVQLPRNALSWLYCMGMEAKLPHTANYLAHARLIMLCIHLVMCMVSFRVVCVHVQGIGRPYKILYLLIGESSRAPHRTL